MRKLFLLPAVLLGISVVFQSCSKQSISETVAPTTTNVISITLAPNGNYQLPIDNSENVSISIQASHFQVSQTELDSKSGFTIYKYVPAADYRGIDEVVLSSTKTIITNAINGCPGNHTSNSDNTNTTSSSTSYTTIKLNITD